MIEILKMPKHYTVHSNNDAGDIKAHFSDEIDGLKIALKLYKERPIMSADRQSFAAKGVQITQTAPNSTGYILTIKHQPIAVSELELDSLMKQINKLG